MHKAGYLLDVNTLIALSEEEHDHYALVMQWFQSKDLKVWGISPFAEAGFLRLATNPRVGSHTLDEARSMLREFAKLPGYRFWPVEDSWLSLTEAFSHRMFGHQQITDAYMLGMAVLYNGVLVTLDKGIKYLAGPEFADHVLVLE